FMSNSKLERLCGFRRSMTQAGYARLLCIADGCNCSAPTCPGCANGRGGGSITDQENSGSLEYSDAILGDLDTAVLATQVQRSQMIQTMSESCSPQDGVYGCDPLVANISAIAGKCFGIAVHIGHRGMFLVQ